MNKSKGFLGLTSLVRGQDTDAHKVCVDAKHTNTGEDLQAAIYGLFHSNTALNIDTIIDIINLNEDD